MGYLGYIHLDTAGVELMTETIVNIEGYQYRYQYNPDTQLTEYLGPVGDSPPLKESEFLAVATLQVKVLSPEEKIQLGHSSIMRWYALGQPNAFSISRTNLPGPPTTYDDSYVVVRESGLVGSIEVDQLKIYDENGTPITEIRF